jgi:hypothetical protein
MAPSIRPVWVERLVCRRCGEEFCPAAGEIPGFIAVEGPGGMAIPASPGQPPLPLPRFLLGPGETNWGGSGGCPLFPSAGLPGLFPGIPSGKKPPRLS